MKTKHPNVQNLIAAALALFPLKETIVFVGGATAILYVDEQNQSGARATIDVDCVVEVATRIEFQKIEEKILGFTNQWYADGFSSAEKVKILRDLEISIFRFPYFIASKIDALMSRGLKDLTTSQNFEDILFVIEGRKTFFEDFLKADIRIQDFFRKSFVKIYAHSDFENAFRGNLPSGLTLNRQNQILSVIQDF